VYPAAEFASIPVIDYLLQMIVTQDDTAWTGREGEQAVVGSLPSVTQGAAPAHGDGHGHVKTESVLST
jgi:hypothetical protein